MMSTWVDSATIERSLRCEAGSIAARLGHHLTAWTAAPAQEGRFVARCCMCNETVTITVRKLRAAPISGVAAQLRCRPQPVVAPAPDPALYAG
jgi:hypothetical protein